MILIIPDSNVVSVDGVPRQVDVDALIAGFEIASGGSVHAISWLPTTNDGIVEWRRPPPGKEMVTPLAGGDFDPAPYEAAWTAAANLWAEFRRSDGELQRFHQGSEAPAGIGPANVAVLVSEMFDARQKRWDGGSGIRDATIIEARQIDAKRSDEAMRRVQENPLSRGLILWLADQFGMTQAVARAQILAKMKE